MSHPAPSPNAEPPKHRTDRIILRYLISPGFASRTRCREIADFAKASSIDEVMLLTFAEESAVGFPSRADLQPWMEVACHLKELLEAEGIGLSLNPWSSLYHSPRGRSMGDPPPFRPMVGENGVVSQMSPCPLDPGWQAYQTDFFAALAGQVRPVALWIDDDLRLNNHGAALGWGGCFCDAHLEAFREKVGTPVGRDDLLRAILSPGTPHPWRRIWLELSRDVINGLFAAWCDAIHQASPTTRIGLMCANPDYHGSEGRSWRDLEEIMLRYQDEALFRPHLAPYTQGHALATPPTIAQWTMRILSERSACYTEVENSPRCGPYSKSRAFSGWQMLSSMAAGASGVTINHFDMLGNGIALDPGFGTLCADLAPQIRALSDLNLRHATFGGVTVLARTDLARHLETTAGPSPLSLSQLVGYSTGWADVLSILGIANTFSETLPRDGTLTAVSGATIDALTEQELDDLLAGTFLLDGTAAWKCLQRGKGQALGVRSAEWHPLDRHPYAYEAIVHPAYQYPGLDGARMSAQRNAMQVLRVSLSPEAEVVTEFRDPRDTPLFPGLFAVENSRGGRGWVLATPIHRGDQFFMAFFNEFRRHLLHTVVTEAGISPAGACVNRPLHPFSARIGKAVFVALLNPTDDAISGAEITLAPQFAQARVLRLSPGGDWQECEPFRFPAADRRATFRLENSIPPLRGEFLRFVPPGAEDSREKEAVSEVQVP